MDSRQEVITLRSCRRRCAPCSGLLQNPNRLLVFPSPPCVGGTGCSVWKHRAFFWCLDLGAALLVPPSLWKDPLFNMFTMAALKPLRFSVFALLFISFPSLLLAQDVFKNAHDNVVSLVCAWRVKIKYKRLKKKRSY